MTWNGWNVSQSAQELGALHDELWNEYGFLARQTNFIKQHCEIVARLSEVIAVHGGVGSVDSTALIEGALAHDIGTYAVLNAHNVRAGVEPIFQRGIYIRHGLLGYELLKSHGFSDELAGFARNHTGVGITRKDCENQHLSLPADDYMPRSAEQEIVMLADKFHTKSLPPQFVSEKTARERCAKFGKENVKRWDKLVAKWGAPSAEDLRALAHEYSMDLM